MFHEPIILSPEQSQAASQIREKYVENEFQSWLLFGVTGPVKLSLFEPSK